MATEFYVMLDPQTRQPDTVFRATHDRGMAVERLTKDGWLADWDVYENVVSGEPGLRIVTQQGAKQAAEALFGADAWQKTVKGGEQDGGSADTPTPGEPGPTPADGGGPGAGGPTPAG